MSDPNIEVVQNVEEQGAENKNLEDEIAEHAPTTEKSFDEIVQEVFRGEWGQGQEQRQRLADAGYNHNEVRKAVIRLRNGL